MIAIMRVLKLKGLELAIIVCVGHLAWTIYAAASALQPGEVRSQRNSDFPTTYISRIHLDLTSPNSYVTLTWAGPKSERQIIGPFHSSIGAGWGTNDCNGQVESNCPDSRCTPKGLRAVEGFMDFLSDHPESKYVTLIDARRRIGFHSSSSIPLHPASQGCVRLDPYAARLIHDNSIENVTEVLIEGTWTNPLDASPGSRQKE
jgi:hypothetical protein